MKKINVKQTILSEIKNVELVSVKNFTCKDGYNMTGDVTIEFDIYGRHCGCTKEDFDFGGLFLGGWTEDEGWAEEKAEELGITTDELYNKYDYFDFADEYNEYCAKVIEDEWYDIFGYDDEEDDELMNIVKEYILDNIDKIYRLEDADRIYSLNYESDFAKLFVFGEFVGYVESDYFSIDEDIELFDKKYIKLCNFAETEDDEYVSDYGVKYTLYENSMWVRPYTDSDYSFQIKDCKIENNDFFYPEFEFAA